MKMKSILIVAIAGLSLASCLKDSKSCTNSYGNPSDTEVASLRSWLTAQGITATQAPQGFFYNIIFEGTGSERPTITDSVTIAYKGALTSGSVFDSTATGETRKFKLSQLITGWQVGLPLIKKDGVIDLYLPPAHGYGCDGSGPIPANAITIFRISLKDF